MDLVWSITRVIAPLQALRHVDHLLHDAPVLHWFQRCQVHQIQRGIVKLLTKCEVLTHLPRA